MSDKKPLTVSGVAFEIPEGTTLSKVIQILKDEDYDHFDDKLCKSVRLDFSSLSCKEYIERSPMK